MTPIAESEAQLPAVIIGASPLGGMPDIYGYDVSAGAAIATVTRAIARGFTFFDTSNEYGRGESELRIGAALRQAGTAARSARLASKADPAHGQRTLDGARVRESFKETLARLGVDRLEIFYLHDPERFDFGELISPGGAFDALRDLKSEGLVDMIGVASGDLLQLRAFLETGHLDVVLNHNRFTLLDRSAELLIGECLAAGAMFVNAAPYASGMLAKPLAARSRYQYREASPEIRDTVRWLHAECGRFEVPLAAVALQFSTRDPRISSTVVGVSAPQRIDDLARNIELEVPPELWQRIEDQLAKA